MRTPTEKEFIEMTKEQLLELYCETMEEVGRSFAEHAELFERGRATLTALHEQNEKLRQRVRELEADS